MSFSLKLFQNRAVLHQIRRQMCKATSNSLHPEAGAEPQSEMIKHHENLSKRMQKVKNYSSTQHPEDALLEKGAFTAMFSDLVRQVTDYNDELPEVMDRYARIMHYNMPFGKKNRGLGVVSTYRHLVPPEEQTLENIRLAYVCGWCCEIAGTFLIIIDDFMDGSHTRRRLPCWYRQLGVGLSLANDAVIMESAIYTLLRKNLRNHPAYIHIVDYFHKALLEVHLGQCSDILSHDANGRPRLEVYDLKRYAMTAKYKCSKYVVMPIITAIYLANITDEKIVKQAYDIGMAMGDFYESQDDFTDLYGDQLRKKASDIQEGKCSWLITTTLDRCTPEQRKIVENHYGRSDQESVDIICKLYDDIGIRDLYAREEEKWMGYIKSMVQQVPENILPHDMFKSYLWRLYKNPFGRQLSDIDKYWIM